jgi:hypothetical protein
MTKFFFTALILSISSCSSENNSLCILQATYDATSSSSFIFRKDGSFQWTNGGGRGVFQNEGKYTWKDSIITLDKTGFDNVVKSKRLLITATQPNSHAAGKFLVQVDNQNSVIDSMYIFTIYIDVRDSISKNQ